MTMFTYTMVMINTVYAMCMTYTRMNMGRYCMTMSWTKINVLT